MLLIFDVFLGLFLGYAAASLTEHSIHRHVLHASARTRRLWQRFPRLCAPFQRAFYSHHVVHHARTYRKDPLTQFASLEDQARLDREIPAAYHPRVRREWYGVTISRLGYVLHVLPVLPLLPLVYWVAGPVGLAASLVPVLVIYPLMAAYIHPHIHGHGEAVRPDGQVWKWLSGTRYMRLLRHAHHLHHLDCKCNYNLLLGADLIWGTFRLRRRSAAPARVPTATPQAPTPRPSPDFPLAQDLREFPMTAFRPSPMLPTRHFQTLAAPFAVWPPKCPKARCIPVRLPDGDVIHLHQNRPAGWRPGDPCLLFLPGLLSDAESIQARRMAAKFLRHVGACTFRLDPRLLGASAATSRQFHHGGRSGDAAAALEVISAICPDSPVVVVGFSLGGNIALKMAGEFGDDPPECLRGVAAVSPPVDLTATAAALARPSGQFYHRYFGRTAMALFGQKRKEPGVPDPDCRPRTLHEFVEAIMAPLCGFRDAADYYATCSSAPLLSRIAVPTLILASRDDPVVPVESFDDLAMPPCVRLVLTEKGGHCGFIGRAGSGDDPDARWAEWRVIDWAAGVFAGAAAAEVAGAAATV